MIYFGLNSVARQERQVLTGVSGNTRLVYDGYVGVNGANRQILWGYIQPEWVERIELVPYEANVRALPSFDEYGDFLVTKRIYSAADLDDPELKKYGAITVDANARSVRAVCTSEGSLVYLLLRTKIIFRDNAKIYIPEKIPAGKFKDLAITAEMTAVPTDLSQYVCWLYNKTFVDGTHYGTWTYSGTVSPEPNVAIGAKENIQLGAGTVTGYTTTTLTTIQKIEFGGATFVPEIVFEGGN